MTAPLKVSVAICTWNRARLLDQTLAGLRELHIPPQVEWELLVVNNNSTDHTESVLAKHAGALPLRTLFEKRAGKSRAANLAITEAQGELLLWTDDDVRVERDWLAAYVEAARRWPSAAVFGGIVEPWFEQAPPAWVRDALPLFRDVFALSGEAFPREEGILDGSVHPFGANMALRTAVQRRFPYDPRMGPRPGSHVRNEDAELMERLRRDGQQMVWVPAAKVAHHVPVERMTIAYVRDWKRGEGRSEVLWKGVPAGPRWGGVPRWLWRRFLTERARAAWLRVRGRSPTWLRAYMQAQFTYGMIQECRQSTRPFIVSRDE